VGVPLILGPGLTLLEGSACTLFKRQYQKSPNTFKGTGTLQSRIKGSRVLRPDACIRILACFVHYSSKVLRFKYKCSQVAQIVGNMLPQLRRETTRDIKYFLSIMKDIIFIAYQNLVILFRRFKDNIAIMFPQA